MRVKNSLEQQNYFPSSVVCERYCRKINNNSNIQEKNLIDTIKRGSDSRSWILVTRYESAYGGWWRCRESNSGITVKTMSFYVRSMLFLLKRACCKSTQNTYFSYMRKVSVRKAHISSLSYPLFGALTP